MTLSPNSPNSSHEPGRADRRTIILLLVAIAFVLGLGGWLLWSQNSSHPWGEMTATGDLGLFYMPADFETQEALFLAGEVLALEHPQMLAGVIRSVDHQVDVHLLAGSAAAIPILQSFVSEKGLDGFPLHIRKMSITTPWIRDFGPMTVSDSNGIRSMVDFEGKVRRGQKYDHGLSTQLSVELDVALMNHQLQVEGGDLLSNSRGLGLMSARVLKANEGFRDKDEAGISRTVAALLGMEWIKVVPPLVGEATGHADRFCTFLAPDLVVVARCENDTDPANADLLDGLARELDGMPTVEGPLRVERVEHSGLDDGIWRSYTSIVFANDVVLVPLYPDHSPELDQQALARYRELIPERTVVGIDASGLAEENGVLRDIILNLPVGGPLTSGH